jgi:hypothetical protein
VTYKILITGSRTWTDRGVINAALRDAYKGCTDIGEDVLMINGDCPQGADAIAKEIWLKHNLPIELYPADWGTYGKRAGFIRNKQMVDLKPDICFAFIKDGSKGASMTAKLAEDAGIRTLRWNV